MNCSRVLAASLALMCACDRPPGTRENASALPESVPKDAAGTAESPVQGNRSQEEPHDVAVEPEPPTLASTAPAHPRTPADGRCPPGMLLAEGGTPSKKLRQRWRARYGAVPEDALLDQCMETTPGTAMSHERCVAAGWCVADPKIPHPCHKDGHDITGRECDYAASAPYFSLSAHPWSETPPELADGHCKLQGWRLPQLREWLWVAGGGAEDRKYAWGNEAPTPEHLNAADPAYSAGFCDHPDNHCRSGKEQSTYALHKKDDGYLGLAPAGSYPKGKGRWGHLDLLGNAAQIVVQGDAYFLCGGSNGTYELNRIDLHRNPCEPCGEDCRGAFRCVTDPVAP